MGMYTELFVEGAVRKDAPYFVHHFIHRLFNRNYHVSGADLLAPPDHPFFKCARWMVIGNMSSHYHIPLSISDARDDTGETWFVSRADLKNYEGEIEKFLDWIRPYCSLLRGWHWYEEDAQPTTFNYGAS